MIVNQLLQLENSFQQTVDQIAEAKENKSDLMNGLSKEKKASKLGNAFKLLKSAYKAADFVAKMTIIPAVKEQVTEDFFKVKTGDAEVGSAIFENVKQNALKTGLDVNDSLNNALTFMSMTKNSDQIAQLNGFADRMSTLSTDGKSSKDATRAIMSAMRGDTSSLAKDFNIPDSQIKSFNAEIISSKGNFTAFLSTMDKLSQNQG